jgi:pyruvate/2-oxoglutarate/acetoin dehydrogenase E1 component
MALGAADDLAQQGIKAEVLDLRTIKPLDREAILHSVSKTHRCVIAEQNKPFCGIGAEIAFQIQRLRMLARTIAKLDELLEVVRETKRKLSRTESKQIEQELGNPSAFAARQFVLRRPNR